MRSIAAPATGPLSISPTEAAALDVPTATSAADAAASLSSVPWICCARARIAGPLTPITSPVGTIMMAM